MSYKIIFALCLITSTAFANTPTMGAENAFTSKNFNLPACHTIRSIGDIDIEINTNARQHQATIFGQAKTIRRVRMEVQNSTLFINMLAQQTRKRERVYRPKITIDMPVLKRLTYWRGCGNIKIHSVRPRYPLSLDILGSSKITIDGNIIPGTMIIRGNTQMSAYWISGCDFYLTAMGHARICLAGVVHTFAANAYQSSWIHARYLRTTRGFIKAYDHARVDLNASCNVSTFATPCSNIFYYQNAYLQAPFLQGGGAVIPMMHICYPPCDDCNRDCCKNTWH